MRVVNRFLHPCIAEQPPVAHDRIVRSQLLTGLPGVVLLSGFQAAQMSPAGEDRTTNPLAQFRLLLVAPFGP